MSQPSVLLSGFADECANQKRWTNSFLRLPQWDCATFRFDFSTPATV